MLRIHITKTDIISIFVCIGFFTAWITAATNRFSFSVLVLLSLYCATCLFAGCLLGDLVSPRSQYFNEFIFKFLFGYFTVNSLLFFLTAVIGFNIKIAFYGLCGIILVLTILHHSRLSDWVLYKNGEMSFVTSICVISAFIGTTLWAQDSFRPILFSGDKAIIKPWSDCFLHTGIINMIANGVPYSNFFISGVPAPTYHYASYIFPALLTTTNEISNFQAFNALQTPVGLFLASLAAYALVCSWWGSWPGLVAALGLLLIPDASYQGINNHWFSFHWLTVISPTLLYGIAVITLSWIFLFEGIKTSQWRLIVAAYTITAISVTYKAHIFVANSLIILVFPHIFWKGFSARRKIIVVGLSVALFYAVIRISHQFKSIPFISLDFSAFSTYLAFVVSMIENLSLQHVFSEMIPAPRWYLFPLILILIFYSTFGLFGLLYPVLAFALRKKISKQLLLFPLFIISVYLVMTVGLAYDKNLVGTQEELLHRPFVWAYFILCTWTMGAAYFWRLGNKRPARGLVRWVLLIALIALFGVPWFLGDKVQVGPPWGKAHTWTSEPAGLVRASFFIRNNSRKEDIIQDSKGDPRGMVSALSERQAFIIDSDFLSVKKLSAYSDHLTKARTLKTLTTYDEVVFFVSANKINWYLLHPDDIVGWPKEILLYPVFEHEGFRVYKLGPPSFRVGDPNI